MYLLAYLFSLLISQYCQPANCYAYYQESMQGPAQEIYFDPATFDIPVDHFNANDDRTYANRFWTNDTFYRPGGPVFFYDAGEGGVTDGYLQRAFNASHPLMSLSKEFHGLAIVWEHRFYGLSFPIPLDNTSTKAEKKAAYKFLDTEQALEDAVYFASHFEPIGLQYPEATLKPQNTSWIWIGGSYPGQRAAMIRRRNPDVFFASWSSSAPVEVPMAFPEYYLHISHDLPDACEKIVREAMRYLNALLINGTWLEKSRLRWAIARRWSAARTTSWEKAQFALGAPDYLVADHFRQLVAFDWQWDGTDGQMATTCASISSANFTTDRNAAMETILNAVEANTRHFAGDDSAPDFSFFDSEAWQYQVCTEYFFFFTAAPKDPANIISTVFTTDSIWADRCARPFPWLSRPSAQKVRTPSFFAGWGMNVSNVMFTTGLRDPWHEVSVAPSKGLISGAPRQRTMTDEVPHCGEYLAGDEVFGLTFNEGRHCSDLVPGSEDAQNATALFKKALGKWLPCAGSEHTLTFPGEQWAIGV